MTSFGTMKLSSFVRQAAITSFSVSSTPSSSATYAWIASPSTSSSTPITAASRMPPIA